MKYLVTGGTGFIGRGIVENLLSNGHNVTVFDDDSRGNRNLLAKNDDLTFKNGDIRDSLLVEEATRGIDSIIHLAFVNGTKYFYEKPDLVTDVGIRGMLNVADAAKKHGVKEIVLISSSETYHSPDTIPTPENIPLIIPDILNPRFSYGGAKIASELILVNYCSSFLENWKIVRPHNVYGPKMGLEHVIPALISKAQSNETTLSLQGNGEQMRAFCYIHDFIDAFQLILEDKRKFQIYHLGTDEEVTILKLAQKILSIMDKPLEIEFGKSNQGETRRRCPDISKIRSLGFEPKYNLEAGLRKLIID